MIQNQSPMYTNQQTAFTAECKMVFEDSKSLMVLLDDGTFEKLENDLRITRMEYETLNEV
jgi:hypothetical protein